ncbi:MAG: LCP family protein [Clostridiales bacterium]|nr:LCP family protein [Clostridiales bacterium]
MAKKNYPQRKSVLKRVLLILLALILVLVVGAAIFVNYELSKIGQLDAEPYVEEEGAEESEADEATESDTISEEILEWGEANVVTQVDGVCNILLIGVDSRSDDDAGRSDSMILLSINTITEQISMVSLLRDTYVQIPDYLNNRINAAYRYGGTELLDATIALNYGIQIDYNVQIDFDGFVDVIDTLGGVDIELTEAEVNYLSGGENGEYEAYLRGGVSTDLVVGMNHLDGETVLDYARIRKIDSDFSRTARQRKLITAVFEEMKGESIFALLQVYDAIADDLATDMTSTQIISIAASAYAIFDSGLASYSLPQAGMYASHIIRGMDVLVMNDWDEVRSTLYDWLYGDTDEEEDGSASSGDLPAESSALTAESSAVTDE